MDFEQHALLVTKYVYAVTRTTFCFWLGNLPYVFLLLNGILVENINEAGTLLLTGWFLLPFVLSPCLTACFVVTRKFFIQRNNDFSLLATYWLAYKKEYRNSCFFGSFFLMVGSLLLLAYRYYSFLLGPVGFLFLLLFIVSTYLYLLLLNLLGEQVLNKQNYLRNSFVLTIKYPFLTLTGILEIGLLGYILYLLNSSLLILVAPGAIILLIVFLFRNLFKLEAAEK